MSSAVKTKKPMLERMRNGEALTLSQQIKMIIQLSIPAILAQISSIVMQYIDASMVGRLGADDSAAIGLVSSSTWMFGGLCMAAATGFTVQIAKRTGANDTKGARNLVRLGLVCVTIFSMIMLVLGLSITWVLPYWLGGGEEICSKSSMYFLVYVLSLPVMQLNYTAAGMLQCSGNMKVPGILEIIMCVLDVLFNALLIFPSSVIGIFGVEVPFFGAGLGVMGAALGTALSELVITALLMYFLLIRSEHLHLRKNEKTVFSKTELLSAIKIAIPVGVEQIITCGAYIAFTRIVSPLGTIAIAANSFSITAESLCYMPGYGIGSAATTIIGQSIGAKRYDITKRLGWLTTFSGVAVMTLSGLLMYIIAPYMIALLSPDTQIQTLGAEILRIEAFAEPMYAASIVATGVFRGAGDTVVPSALALISMWGVRIPLAFVLSLSFGLQGVWFAMCIELCVRGLLFITLLATRFRKRAEKGLYNR